MSLANHFDGKYRGRWGNIVREGSKCLSLWESDDLVNWSEQRMIELGAEDIGCFWAPDVIYDHIEQDYVIHWTSAHASNNFGHKAIYYSRTKDFESFSFSFPYRFKHGTVLSITMEEYNRIKNGY